MRVKADGEIILFLAAGLFLLFYGLGSYPLLNNNEGLYAMIARDMLQSGDWVLPRLNGLPYIEKPPMLYWLVAGCFKIFGVNEFAARFGPALAGFCLGCALTWFMRRRGFSFRTSFLAGVAWVSSIGVVVFSRTLIFDVLQALFPSLALMMYFVWREEKRTAPLMLSYLFLACSALVKGLAGCALFSIIVLICEWLRSDGPRLSWGRILAALKGAFSFFDIKGAALFLLVAVPWHVMASREEGEFFHFYFVNEHLLRFLGMRIPDDYYGGPFYYYLPRLPAFLFPWIFLVPAAFFRRDNVQGNVKKCRRLISFLLVWAVSVFLFFSFSKAKANYYIILAMPPIVMLFALWLDGCSDFFKKKVMPFLSLCPLVLVLGFLWHVGISKADDYSDLLSCFSTSRLTWMSLAAALAAVLCLAPRWRSSVLSASVMMVLASSILLLAVLPALRLYSYPNRRVAHTYLRDADGEVLFFKDFEEHSALAFYIGGRVRIVEPDSNDLFFGLGRPCGKTVAVSREEFLEKARSPGRLFLVVRSEREGTMSKELLDMGFKVREIKRGFTLFSK